MIRVLHPPLFSVAIDIMLGYPHKEEDMLRICREYAAGPRRPTGGQHQDPSLSLFRVAWATNRRSTEELADPALPLLTSCPPPAEPQLLGFLRDLHMDQNKTRLGVAYRLVSDLAQ